jgi:hypothetical protein
VARDESPLRKEWRSLMPQGSIALVAGFLSLIATMLSAGALWRPKAIAFDTTAEIQNNRSDRRRGWWALLALSAGQLVQIAAPWMLR